MKKCQMRGLSAPPLAGTAVLPVLDDKKKAKIKGAQRTRRGDLCVDKKHSKARTKTLLRKNRRHIFTPMFGKIGFQRKMSIFDRRPNAPPCDERSTERNEERKECARHTAYNLSTELLKMKGPYTHAHKTDLCRRYVRQTQP